MISINHQIKLSIDCITYRKLSLYGQAKMLLVKYSYCLLTLSVPAKLLSWYFTIFMICTTMHFIII
jgi:hypothetical protein